MQHASNTASAAAILRLAAAPSDHVPQFIDALARWRPVASDRLEGGKLVIAERQSVGTLQHGEPSGPACDGAKASAKNIVKRGLIPAGIEGTLLLKDGKPKYTGMHVFRHFYASWCIDRNLPPKVVQERLGHSSITITYDRYGHLFPRGDDAKEIDAAELRVVGSAT